MAINRGLLASQQPPPDPDWWKRRGLLQLPDVTDTRGYSPLMGGAQLPPRGPDQQSIYPTPSFLQKAWGQVAATPSRIRDFATGAWNRFGPWTMEAAEGLTPGEPIFPPGELERIREYSEARVPQTPAGQAGGLFGQIAPEFSLVGDAAAAARVPGLLDEGRFGAAALEGLGALPFIPPFAAGLKKVQDADAARRGLSNMATSRLRTAVEQAPQAKATGGQWLGMIRNAPGGVARGESEFTGLQRLLSEDPNRMFTRDELLGHMDEYGIELKETWRTGEDIGQDEPRFEGQTQLGGTNYREVTLQLGDSRRQALQNEYDDLGLKLDDARENPDLNWRLMNGYDLSPEHEAMRDRRTEIGDLLIDMDDATYTRSHWEEPNVLVHVRMKDRIYTNPVTGKEERVLFVEEFQSDWHQQGRKWGYQGELDLPEGWSVRQASEGDLAEMGFSPEEIAEKMANPEAQPWDVHQPDELGVQHGDELVTIVETAPTREEAISAAHQFAEGHGYAYPKNRPPDAPFKNTGEWTELAIKRMVQEGIDGGYDRVAFASGEQVANINDLRRHVDEISYNEATGTLEAWSTSGTRVVNETGVTPEQLPGYIGDGPAERLLDADVSGSLWKVEEFRHHTTDEPVYSIYNPRGDHVGTRDTRAAAQEYAEHLGASRRIVGEDLAVGGEGMMDYYDKIVPRTASRYGNQIGGLELEEIDLGLGGDSYKGRTESVREFHETRVAEERELLRGEDFMTKDNPFTNVPGSTLHMKYYVDVDDNGIWHAVSETSAEAIARGEISLSDLDGYHSRADARDAAYGWATGGMEQPTHIDDFDEWWELEGRDQTIEHTRSTAATDAIKEQLDAPRPGNLSFEITPEMRSTVRESGQRLWGAGGVGLLGYGAYEASQRENEEAGGLLYGPPR